MKQKVIIVKQDGSKLEAALNDGWNVYNVSANENCFVYLLKK